MPALLEVFAELEPEGEIGSLARINYSITGYRSAQTFFGVQIRSAPPNFF
jgi:hypothetical protein